MDTTQFRWEFVQGMGQFRYLLITTATGRRFGVAEMYDGVNC
jgi:hypothetical protein